MTLPPALFILNQVPLRGLARPRRWCGKRRWRGYTARTALETGPSPGNLTAQLNCPPGKNRPTAFSEPPAAQKWGRQKSADDARRLTPPAGGSICARTNCSFLGAIPSGHPASESPRRFSRQNGFSLWNRRNP